MDAEVIWRIDQGDCRELLRGMADESFAACLCDPPYGLSFMGKNWDHGVPGVPYWAEVLRVLKPGAVLMAFGGTRTHHRLMVAIEDAGFEIFDCMMWLYGSGFPKSHDISKAIDKAAGAERKKIAVGSPVKRMIPGADQDRTGSWIKDNGREYQPGPEMPATPGAATWQGYGTALKPAYEPIILARKPRRTTYATTALEHGSGALWIDGGRIGTEKRPVMVRTETIVSANAMSGESTGATNNGEMTSLGRWPANLLLSHSPGCVRRGERRVKSGTWGARQNTMPGSGGTLRQSWRHEPSHDPGVADADGLETIADWDCVPDCAVRLLGEQSGERPISGTAALGNIDKAGRAFFGGSRPGHESIKPKDIGTAARFFKNFDPPTRFVYSGKASRAERDKGLEGMPEVVAKRTQDGGDDTRGRPTPRNRNPHPTIKPLAVTRYLATLLLPPESYRDDAVLLVPFCGVGSEIIGALRAGWRHVVGIELSEEYAAMARRRIVADSPLFNHTGG